MSYKQEDELLNFAARTLRSKGAAVEKENGTLTSVLPPELVGVFGREYMEITRRRSDEDAEKLLYGSPLLDKIIGLACAGVPISSCSIYVRYLKKQGFQQIISDQFKLHKATGSVESPAETRGDYLLSAFRYTALSDERKEGLIKIIMNLDSKAIIPELEENLSNAEIKYVKHKKFNSSFADRLRKTIEDIRPLVRQEIEKELTDFKSSMKRRCNRDTDILEEYYKSYAEEIRSSFRKRKLSEKGIEERKEKLASLPDELAMKKNDLFKKYSIQVTVSPVAALHISMPVVRIIYKVKSRNRKRTISMYWNPLTKKLEPVVCEGCGINATELFVCRETHILCPDCSENCPLCR